MYEDESKSLLKHGAGELSHLCDPTQIKILKEEGDEAGGGREVCTPFVR